MNSRSRLCLYTITLSYIMMEIIKLWVQELHYQESVPLFLYLPLVPALLGLLACVLGMDEKTKKDDEDM